MGFAVPSRWLCLILMLGSCSCEDAPEPPPCRQVELDGGLEVDCSDLGLTEMPAGLDYDQVQVLDLSNNNFVDFPPELQYFTRLEKLTLAGNHLSGAIPSFLSKWDQLHTLNLSDNNYMSWATPLNASLRKLDLSKNKINTIDEAAFSGMSSLHFLDLSENRISNLPAGAFSEASSLDNLVLSRNEFSAVPDISSSSLRSLDLSSCQLLTVSPRAVAGLTALLALDLSMNQLEFLPDHFSSGTLQQLDLSYNAVSDLTDHTFSSLPHLAVLDLRGNDFRDVFPTSVFASNPFLRELRLKGNRWSCDGFNLNLFITYEYLTREPPKVADQRSLVCYSPFNVSQLSWQEAYIQTWHPSEGYDTFSMVALMIGVIIGVVLTSAICRGLMALNRSEDPPASSNNVAGETRLSERVESVVLRIPLREDLPPTYDEALLMPRLNASFHSLPDFVDEEPLAGRFRRSRSIGDLVEPRPRGGDRRSVRRTVQISIE